MSRRSLFIFLGFFGLLLAVWLSLPAVATPVLAQITVPSRTPTPPPGGGDDGGNNDPGGGDNDPGDDGDTDPNATATSTAEPGAVPPTPEGGYYPTAAACGTQPTIRASDNLNVRLGPAPDYERVGRLIYLEVRPIIGRSGFDEWWLIELSDGSEGWVANRFVEVSGYTGLVPIVPAPPLDGETPTPGPTWEPTPRPNCTVTPTETPSATPSPSATATLAPGVTPTETPVPSDTPTATATDVPPPTNTATVAPTATNTSTPAPQPTAANLDGETGGGGSNLLLYGGVGLIALGVFGFFVLGRRREDEADA